MSEQADNKINVRSRLLAVALLMIGSACSSNDPVDADGETYDQAVSDFYVSLAASQTEEARFAFNKMNDVATAFPEEPAAWANLGVLAMRQGNFELADERFSRARELAENNARVLYLSGLFESRRGEINSAIQYFDQALRADPQNPRIRFSLIKELERQDDQLNRDQIIEELEYLKQLLPQNRVLLFEQARIAAREENAEMLTDILQQMESVLHLEKEELAEQYRYVKELADSQNFSEINLELTFLRNLAEPEPAFQSDLRQLESDPNEIGFLITEFINLDTPESSASEPDLQISFDRQLPEGQPDQASFVTSATLLEELPPIPVAVTGGRLRIDSNTQLDVPAPSNLKLQKNSVAFIDFNYNFRADVAMAGPDGFYLYRQEEDQSFENITQTLGLGPEILNQAYRGVWPADVDLDGDLDLVLGAAGSEPFVLRNQSDGSFSKLELFTGFDSIRDFLWADLDADGAADALFLDDQGSLHLFRNLRSNNFSKVPELPVEDSVTAMSVADLTANGLFDIALTTRSSGMIMLSYNTENDNWQRQQLISAENLTDKETDPNELFTADIDNNGSLDLIHSTADSTNIWLTDSSLNLTRLPDSQPGGLYSIFDIDGDDRLDLLGIDRDGKTYGMMNTGTRNYNARLIRARASGPRGDQRINSFGIGGEMEVRTGRLYQKRLITSPIVHFGLGEREEAEMLRIIWPNGSVQAEFAELGMGSTIFNEQVLKGSCPWLFTNDGEEIQFITDILWRSPLGLRINAQETAGVIQTLDRVKIPGDALTPVEGKYDLRITAELWETHFFDHVDLIAVDHPENSEIFIDERFVFPAPDLSTRVMELSQPVQRVMDENGRDWTETVSAVDGTYMKAFEQTSYQGLVENHAIEVDLGDAAESDRTIWLIASGWLKPTDSSINLALSQGNHQPPKGLKVEVPDGQGGWNTVHENYGVPAGKSKSILIKIDPEVLTEGAELKVRLSTTSEIYWDAFRWSRELDGADITQQSLAPVTRELRYRGYSEWNKADSLSPLIPDYSELSGTAPRWRDLIGYHTRFGDVGELLDSIDDRYVIMNAGDEMFLEYASPGEPAPGYKRSFVFVSDGWVKDGDYNTEASKTVTPLPFHGQADYEYGEHTVLSDDPVYRQHRADWVNYHTRYVTPNTFRSALNFNNRE